ncbi:MAG TPA: flagellar biosynthetic protein FliR [Sphingomonas sp.]|uniref:flagellar biosynthetic protein FliR n=1 Tax=Sphingomonas sp. TaxID=28214 RepID=UPI002ED88FDC
MIPTGFAGVETQLWIWMLAMIRPGAAFLAAPIFGAAHVPVQVRLIISLAVGIPAVSVVPFALPPEGFASIAGFALVAGEILAGLALGFAVQIGFSSALLAGETMGNAMGLGFASMLDPMSGQQSQAIGQFLTVLGTFLFLAMGGHLLLAMIVFDSYKALPPGQAWLTADALRGLVRFGGTIFAAGMVIALPVGFAVVLVQLVMGMLARSAPALNLFSVGLPAALLAGLILMAFAAPSLAEAITRSMTAGLEYARTLSAGGS